MSQSQLSDRSFVAVNGKDAADFLQGLITTNIETLGSGEALPGALLTPQGKILFDFLISRSADGFRLETSTAQLEGLIKRLNMYKLRADVLISADLSTGVTVIWDEPQPDGSVVDMRFMNADVPLFRLAGGQVDNNSQAYDALRTLHGIAESGFDYALADAFPHDVLLDLNGGVSFRKGCYVGQEVVSRMQHRGTARRRIVIVRSESRLPVSGTDLIVDNKIIGTLGTVADNVALALCRIDKAGEALEKNTAITAGGVVVSLSLPAWSRLSFPTSADEVTA